MTKMIEDDGRLRDAAAATLSVAAVKRAVAGELQDLIDSTWRDVHAAEQRAGLYLTRLGLMTAGDRFDLDDALARLAAAAAREEHVNPQAAADPGATGQAIYETWRAAIPGFVCNVPGGPWEDLSPAVQAGFNAIAARQQPAPGTQDGDPRDGGAPPEGDVLARLRDVFPRDAEIGWPRNDAQRLTRIRYLLYGDGA